ncbi:hypothetical protein ABIA71_000221 [Stenotrophomonas sp. 2619]|uniref:hypothetical protein n=1 Tax=Stenotrophomonas sp. 2619 TaxID=3156316 RepID=UPI0033979998
MIDFSPAQRGGLPPLTGTRWPIRCGHGFSAEELAQLRDGLWPRASDDRWAVWLDGSTLRCWRALTSGCIYESVIVMADDGSGTAVVLDVLDDPAQYQRASTDSGELERFEGVVRLALAQARAA